MRKILLLALAGFLFCTGCAQKNKAKYTITISGAFALYPMMIRWSEEFRKVHPEIGFDINAGGAGKGMSDVLAGMVDIAMVSRDITTDEEGRGAWYIAVAYDAVIPVMNAENPFREYLQTHGLKQAQFKAIFVDKTMKYWEELTGQPGTTAINIYTRADSCGAAETWAKYLGGKQENLTGIGVSSDPGLAEAVRNDKLGMGYNNVNYAFNPETQLPVAGILPIPLDINSNGKIDPREQIYQDLNSVTSAIAQGVYPSPPARNLYLVCKGGPTNENLVMFLRWILTEGQGMTLKNGYVPVSQTQLSIDTGKLP